MDDRKYELVVDNIYRVEKKNHKYNYYLKLICADCGEEFMCDKYQIRTLCNRCRSKHGYVGRPAGFKMLADSRKKISDSRIGKITSEDTKNKISATLIDTIINGKSNNRAHIPGPDNCNYLYGTINNQLYAKWINILHRCYCKDDKNYKYYGGRGIKVCDDWVNNFLAFKKFCEDSGCEPGLHTHRLDPDGDYEPSNVIFLNPSAHAKLHWFMRKYKGEQ